VNTRHWLGQAKRADATIYAAVAHTDIPPVDRAMRGLSNAANYSRLWIATAGILAAAGGETGRHAATDGLASIALTATIVNAALKPLGNRRRPAPEAPAARRVHMPRSRSFPSGHAATAFAFATAVAHTDPHIARPLRALAALVAYSRVHTGVHYPGDVVIGSLLGISLAQLTLSLRERRCS
jgi:membrane-associated phospholipid phosphatase